MGRATTPKERPVSTRTLLAALTTATSLVALAGCTGEPLAQDSTAAGAPADGTAGGTPSAEPVADPLAGTYQTSAMSLRKMARTAEAAGFATADVREYLAGNFPGAHQVEYSLKLADGWWIVFNEIDGGSAEEAWSGPYHVVDATTVEAGAPPCGPITYGYRLEGDVLSLDLLEDDCPGPDGQAPLGELIAQTIISETDTYQRVG
jgi:hypothetical protein